MSEITVNFIAGVLSIIFMAVAGFFAYNVYKFNKQSKPWLAIYLGFVAEALYGTLTYFSDNAYLALLDQNVLKTLSGILLLLASALFAWGFWSMNKSFESFAVLRSKTQEKIEAFAKAKKKK